MCAIAPPRACPISRRRYKRDIEYVDREALTRLYAQLRAIKLASYRYKSEEPSAPPRLGFIIDDIEPSPSIDSTGDRVDLYGYLSMAVAAIQMQATEITTLQQEIEGLRHDVEQIKEMPKQPLR